MKRRLTALICALTLALGLVCLPAAAGDELFFLSINDTLPAASPQITPIQSGGWIYVPCSVFSSRVTGVNLGVYYGFTDNGVNLVFYNLSGKTLTFDLTTNTASTSTGETVMPGRTVWQNGICYAPAYAVCSFFGLSYSYHTTDYGPLLRIRNGSAQLSDAAFLSSAASLMRSRYNAAHPVQPAQTEQPAAPTPASPSAPANQTPAQTQTPAPAQRPAASPVQTPAPAAQTEPDEPEEETPDPPKTFSLFVGLRAQGDVTAALDALADANVTAVVFFPAEDLISRADDLRQAAGRGHRVGLIPTGDTPAQRLESARAGSEAMTTILRQEAWFVLASDQELADGGFLPWKADAVLPESGDAYQTVYDAGTAHTDPIRLLAGTGQSLSPLLRQLAQDGDTFLAPRETRY